MASFKTRRLLKGTGGARFGTGTAYTDVSTGGVQTMATTARVCKDIYIRAEDFFVDSGVSTGSMSTGSMTVAIGGSIFASAGSLLRMKYITPSANITGSVTQAFVSVPVPTDADTTGSIAVKASWTIVTNPATTGCAACMKVGAGYFGSGSTIRTAASTGACPLFTGTTGLVWQEASIGNLPSFSASDKWLHLVFGLDQSDAGETIGGSDVRISNVRLTYTANKLGTASSE